MSDRAEGEELGHQQLAVWSEAIRRALAFRDRVGESGFADLTHPSLQTDPVGAVVGPRSIAWVSTWVRACSG